MSINFSGCFSLWQKRNNDFRLFLNVRISLNYIDCAICELRYLDEAIAVHPRFDKIVQRSRPFVGQRCCSKYHADNGSDRSTVAISIKGCGYGNAYRLFKITLTEKKSKSYNHCIGIRMAPMMRVSFIIILVNKFNYFFPTFTFSFPDNDLHHNRKKTTLRVEP
jgi:hypothetical protein